MSINFKVRNKAAARTAIAAVPEAVRIKARELAQSVVGSNPEIEGVFANDSTDEIFSEFNALAEGDVVQYDEEHYVVMLDDAVAFIPVKLLDQE